MEFGTQMAGHARAQWQLKDSNADLASRVAKLEEIVSKLVKPAA